MKRFFLILIVIVIFLFVSGYFFIVRKNSAEAPAENINIYVQVENSQLQKSENEIQDNAEAELEKNKDKNSLKVLPKSNMLAGVPFVLQAPFGNWNDPLFQDACEEAAILMADGWLKGNTYLSDQIQNEIKKIVILEEKMLGQDIDTSVKDTVRVMKEYTGHKKIEVVEGIKIDNLKDEVLSGRMVIVPTDGRKLGNPFYTSPGPVTHMLVIVGYDAVSGEFITNDSGTKMGKDYRYNEDVLFGAIRDYPTGNHHLNMFDEKLFSQKVMIVISENKMI